MNRTGYYFLLLIMLITASCTANRKLAAPRASVAHISDTVTLREGSLVYALPRTVFTIRIEFERVVETPGPYAKNAGDLLGLAGVIQAERETWSVKSVSVNSHDEADPSEYYVIETESAFRTNILSLKREGIILDLNPAVQVRGEDLVKGREMNSAVFVPYDLGSDEYFQVLSDTALRRVRVDSSFIRIPYLVEKKKKLTTDQLAERAARRITELRDGRILILTGEANVFPQSSAAIDEINRLEKQYLQLFTGKTFRSSCTYTYQVIPTPEMRLNPFILSKFSEASGPSEVSSGQGIPISFSVFPEQKTKDITIITRAKDEPSAVIFDKLYYRIPDVAVIRITLGDEILYTSRRLVYQFGEIMQLPANYVIGK